MFACNSTVLRNADAVWLDIKNVALQCTYSTGGIAWSATDVFCADCRKGSSKPRRQGCEFSVTSRQ